MVQITNALLFAAAVAPAFAAPLVVDSNPIEAREPRVNVATLKKAGRIGGKIASVGATLAPLVIPQNQQQPRDLDAREPRITSAQVHSIAKGAGRVAKHAQSGIEFATAVAPLFPHQRRQLEAREPRLTAAQVKSIAKGAGRVAKHAQSGIEFGAAVAPLFPHQRRSFDDLAPRAPKMSHSTMRGIGGAVVGAAGFGGTIAALNTRPSKRDLGDLEIREPKFPGFLKKVASFVIREDETPDMYVRDIEDFDLDAREPKFPGFLKKIGKVASLVIREDENGDLYIRDYDDLDLD